MKRGHRFGLTLLAATIFGLGLAQMTTAAKPPGRAVEQGAHLVLANDPLGPEATFEVRFDEPVVAQEEVGLPAKSCPLVFRPALAGGFFWLSRQSGVFTPSETLPLAQTYEVSLRSGLQRADGSPLKARLQRQVATPDFNLAQASPHAPNTNAPAVPLIQLFFPDAVDAKTAPAFLKFVNAAGQTVPAEVRQATRGETGYGGELGWSGFMPWPKPEAKSPAKTPFPFPVTQAPEAVAAEPIPHHLVVKPARPLHIADGWALVVNKGLPSADKQRRTATTQRVPVGNVTPFTATHLEARNFQIGGREAALRFSKPLSPTLNTNNIFEWIAVDPSPSNLVATMHGNSVVLHGNFALRTRYDLTVKAGLPAEGPFTLKAPFAEKFSFAPLEPAVGMPVFSSHQLSGGRRELEFIALNVPALTLQAKLIDPESLIHVLRGYRSYFPKFDADFIAPETAPQTRIDPNLIAGRTMFRRELQSRVEEDVAVRYQVGWDEVLAGRRFGAVFLSAESTKNSSQPHLLAGAESIVQLTDLGLVVKRSDQGWWVHVFSYATGQPVPGAKVQLRTGENELLGEQIAGAQGQAHFAETSEADLWLLVKKDDDVHAVPLHGQELEDISRYQFRLPEDFSDRPTNRRVFLFSDRDLYKPGETVHLKAVVRDWQDGALVLPKKLEAALLGFDPRARQICSNRLVFSETGAANLDLPIPQEPCGQYTLRLDFETNSSAQYYFRVAQYQPNAFEVQLDHPTACLAGDDLKLTVRGNYYMGKPLAKAKVKWLINAADAGFAPDGLEDFLFIGQDSVDNYREQTNETSMTLEGEAELAAQGDVALKPALNLNSKLPQPRTVQVEAEVTDLNQQTVSHGAVFTLHSSQFYLGLKKIEGAFFAGQPWPLEVVAVNSTGQPLTASVPVQVKVQKIEWLNLQMQGAGRGRMLRSEPQLHTVSEFKTQARPLQRLGTRWELAPGGNTAVVTLPGPGEYLVETTATDAAGRAVRTAMQIYALGQGEASWSDRYARRMDLVPDQASYRPGEAAKIFVKAPYAGPALVTIEREGVLRQFTAELTGNASSISVPLQESDAPNVFVSVMLLRGYEKTKRQVKLPDYRVGYCQLNVELPARHLQVAITPSSAEFRPGQTVNVEVQVNDGLKQAVPEAEVTLFAVDEGVLSLTGFRLADPYAFFYAIRPLKVDTKISIDNLAPENPEETHFNNKGYAGGGGGDEPGLRKNFLACAFWQATLRTDAGGKLSTSFPAPDALTRYRIYAVATAKADLFGKGEGVFAVNKPLMLEPVLPRFANVGDTLVARALLHNQSGQDGDIEITLQTDGCIEGGAAPVKKSLSLRAGGTGYVEFPVRCREAGRSQWTWRAALKKADSPASDAVVSHLEIGYAQPVLHEFVARRVVAAKTSINLGKDPQLAQWPGEVKVRVANSRAIGLEEAVTHLLHYPYGCVEQTTSSLLPWLAAAEVPVLRERLKPADADKAIAHGISRLFSMQTAGGGLSYWPGQAAPMLWGSAYGGLGLVLAKRQGVALPEAALDQLLQYLSESLRQAADLREASQLSERVLALLTLALADRPEPAYYEIFFAKRDTLSAEDRAMLALAIIHGHGDAHMAEELLRPAKSATTRSYDWFDSPSRELAIQLMAWCNFRPEDSHIDELAEQLMTLQEGAHWGTTQGNAWGLLALAEYVKKIEGARANVAGTIAVGGESKAFALNSQSPRLETTFRYNPAQGAPVVEVANPGSQTIYLIASLEVRSQAAQSPRQDRGFALKRTYQLVGDGGELREFNDPRVGDRVLVRLELDLQNPAHFVAVEDPFPAILEGVNPAFVSAQAATNLRTHGRWYSDFSEMKNDRITWFRDHLAAGHYTIEYLARVRAAGQVVAPPAKVEEMYHPNRYGLTDMFPVASKPMN